MRCLFLEDIVSLVDADVDKSVGISQGGFQEPLVGL